MNRAGHRVVLIAWTILLLGLLTFPLLAPGQLALRDMMVLDRPALSPAALGFGDLPARNAPQDGLLALVGMVLPASWFVRVLIIGAGALGAFGAARLAAHCGGRVAGQLAAITVVLWNPFIIERFLQGHWSLVIAAWLLPLIAVAGLRGNFAIQLLAMWLASLTPTGALFAVLTAVSATRRKLLTAGLGAVICLPWLVPGLLAQSTSAGAGAAAFAPRAESGVGTLGSLLGLGGIWNAEAVPASREAGFAVVGVLLFAVLLLGVRTCPRPLLWLAAFGLGMALLSWLLPAVMAWAIAHIPGVALLRDSQKLVMLAIPAYAAMAGGVSVGRRPPFSGRIEKPREEPADGWRRVAPAVLVILLAMLQVPDAPQAMRQLSPIAVPVDEELVSRADGRDVLLVEAAALTVIDGRVVVEPHSKTLSLVESGALVVDGQVVDPPARRWVAAQEAWAAGNIERLENLGVGLVVEEDRVVSTGAAAQHGWEFWLGLALLVGWVLVPVGILGSLWRRPPEGIAGLRRSATS